MKVRFRAGFNPGSKFSFSGPYSSDYFEVKKILGSGMDIYGSFNAEMFSRIKIDFPKSISLRGSLADKYYELQITGQSEKISEYVRGLIMSNDPDLIIKREEKCLIIGKKSEIGKYQPDW